MLFSVRSALIHRSCIAISVITGAPGCAKWPTSVRRSVTTPRAGATTRVRARSSSAFSTAATALRSCALSSPASPAASCALRRSAWARRTLLRASSRVACAISRRRTEIAPGSSSCSFSSRLASRSAMSRLASDTASEARAASTPATEPLTELRTDSRSARARSSAMR